MIAKSDMVILVVSASVLAAGIYRWQNNVSRTYDRRAVSSSPATTGADNSQRSSAGTLAAKPETAGVTPSAGAGADASVQTSTGNRQSATQNAAGSAGNLSTTGTTAGQSIANSSANNTTGQPLYGTYEVKSGDTLSKIAVDYDTTVAQLRSINNISGSLIDVGQNIRYPLPAN